MTAIPRLRKHVQATDIGGPKHMLPLCVIVMLTEVAKTSGLRRTSWAPMEGRYCRAPEIATKLYSSPVSFNKKGGNRSGLSLADNYQEDPTSNKMNLIAVVSHM